MKRDPKWSSREFFQNIMAVEARRMGVWTCKCCEGRPWMAPQGKLCKYSASSSRENESLKMKTLWREAQDGPAEGISQIFIALETWRMGVLDCSTRGISKYAPVVGNIYSKVVGQLFKNTNIWSFPSNINICRRVRSNSCRAAKFVEDLTVCKNVPANGAAGNFLFVCTVEMERNYKW